MERWDSSNLTSLSCLKAILTARINCYLPIIYITRIYRWLSDSDLEMLSERYTFAANVIASSRHIAVRSELHCPSFAALLSKMKLLVSLR